MQREGTDTTQVTEAERKAIAAAFQDATSVRSNGVMIGGEKYFVLDVDEENLKAKKVGCSSGHHILRDRHSDPNLRTAKRRPHRLQDHPGPPHRPSFGRGPNHQRLRDRRRFGRLPQRCGVLSGGKHIFFNHGVGMGYSFCPSPLPMDVDVVF